MTVAAGRTPPIVENEPPGTPGDLLAELAVVEGGLREALSAVQGLPAGEWLDGTVPELLAALQWALAHLQAARLLLGELD